tara:strand:- start:1284 stop:1811 length:528 start_codon:yes stop_codon:yes gene_type:complete
MNHFNYQEDFKTLYNKAVSEFSQGNKDMSTYYSEAEIALIKSNGWRIQDFFDYAEDAAYDNVPTYEMAQSIEQARREYFFNTQNSTPSTKLIYSKDLTAKNESLAGLTWLPRIIEKAKGKLSGELADEIMYCCGGDRNFLSTHNVHPAEFLRVVLDNWDNQQAIIDFVKNRSTSM